MREIGKIVKTENGYATVSIDKKEECSKCGMCAFPKNANTIEFKAKNQVNAQLNDTVVIDRKTDGKISGIILVFLIPLLLVGLSIVLTYTTSLKEIWILVFSAGFLVIWYTVLSIIDKKLSKKDKFLATVIEVVENKQKENFND